MEQKMNWLKKIFKPKIIVKYRRIRKPKKGEMIIFSMPSDSTMENISELKDIIDKEMKKDQLYLIMSSEIKISIIDKKSKIKCTKN